jgi:non-heme chloroperoxidase
VIKQILTGAAALLLLSSYISAAENPTTHWRDPSPHKIRRITVDKDVQLEVLDWGGSGPSVILLAGLGNNGHFFDYLGPRLKSFCHPYAITRRGFPPSSIPAAGYSADRLGDDVLAVMDALKLKKAILIGHSLGGEELSSAATRYPQRVAGLVYLEAGPPYAYFNDGIKSELYRSLELARDREELDRDLGELGKAPYVVTPLAKKLLDKTLPEFESDLRRLIKYKQGQPPPPPPPTPDDLSNFISMAAWYRRVMGYNAPEAGVLYAAATTPDGHLTMGSTTPPAVFQAITAGFQHYTDIPTPALGIFASTNKPANLDLSDPEARSAAETYSSVELAFTEYAVAIFKRSVPNSRTVIIQHSDHFVYLHDETPVVNEIHSFIASLRRQ